MIRQTLTDFGGQSGTAHLRESRFTGNDGSMIWFGNIRRIVVRPPLETLGFDGDVARMQAALERVAETTPSVCGPALLDALEATGWVDRDTAARLLPHFRHFDPDRHFAEYLRRLSFRGPTVAEEFRAGIRYVFEEIVGSSRLDQVGPEPCIRFGLDSYEGVVLAQPEVGFTIGGRTRDALVAAIEEMPDAVVIVARNFDPSAAEQLSGILHRTGVPGTLLTVNLLLGIRATTLKYQPSSKRVIELLSRGGTLRSADVARLGDRAA